MDTLGDGEAGRLLRLANLHRLRGELPAAVQACRQAIALSPQDLGAREMLADLLQAQGNTTAAEQAYRDVLRLSPGRLSAQMKLGEIITRRGDVVAVPRPPAAPQPRPLPAVPATPPPTIPATPPPAGLMGYGSGYLAAKSPVKALFLSGLAPGLGQFYNGEPLKGLLMLLATAVLSILLVRPLLPALQAYTTTLSGALASAGSEDFSLPSQPLLPALTPSMLASSALFAGLLAAVYLYSLVDAFAGAVRANRQRRST